MLVGTLGAINQKKIKRLFAYSSIAHVGYLLIGLATGSIEAVESLLIYIAVYIVTAIGAFGTILAMSKENYHSFGRAGFGFTGSLPQTGGNPPNVNTFGGHWPSSFIYSLVQTGPLLLQQGRRPDIPAQRGGIRPEQLEEKMK